MLSYLKFYNSLYDCKCDGELSSSDSKFLRQALCECLLIVIFSAPRTLPGMKKEENNTFSRIVNE